MIFDNNTVSNIAGEHNSNLAESASRIVKSNTFRELHTVWVTPTVNHRLDDQVVFQSWMSVAIPPNQKFARLCVANAEVGDAYNAAVELILKDSTPWKYLLTVESDNLPPCNGLMRLYESVDKYDVVAGLYWMKNQNPPRAHIYGDPSIPGSWAPQVPLEETVQPCNMTAMGFTLFNVDIFRKMPKPWFKSSSAEDNDSFTQDGYFFQKAHSLGLNLRVAVDTRVKVGHIDFETRKIW
jgi:hypothetical protein